MQYATVLSLLTGAAHAIPFYEVEMPEKRQSGQPAEVCNTNTCDGCPYTIDYGTGYPNCLIYNTQDAIPDALAADENGRNSAFFSFPEPDFGCRFIVLTPAGRDMDRCGTPAVVASGAGCQRVSLDSSFMLQFCCGTDDCNAAATKRRDINDIDGLFGRSAGGGAVMLLNSTSGLPLTPMEEGPSTYKPSRKLMKRDCDNWVTTSGPYSSIGAPIRVSGDVRCPPTGECSAALTMEASQSRTLSISVSIGDPWGVLSASVGMDFTEERSRSFTGTFNLGEGNSGYVAYTPYTTCVTGHFEGDCDGNGQEIEACYPNEDSDGVLAGELRGVLNVT